MAATSSISEAQAELIKSLSQEDIPAKLRCAICSKLAVNAFRLPCCEQAICEDCQSTLPQSCPVCEHSPLSADDCKPHKSLRTTIRVFLRTEEKKRETNRPKDASPITPVESTPLPIAAPAKTEQSGTIQLPIQTLSTGKQHSIEPPAGEAPGTEGQESNEQVKSQGADTLELDGSRPDQTSQDVTDESGEASNATALVPVPADGEVVESIENVREEDVVGDEKQLNPGFAGPVGFENMAAQFPGMNFGAGGLDQMQMMMAMQNGMAPNGLANFSMMAGMPGMNMDPMTMQMYMNMNGGFQGMGMNGMNGMNMGMGGYGGEANNNWNGQQSWNVGQDNFNHPNASGMGNGDYGTFNSGFQTGYNQGNYGHQNQYNDYRRNQFGFRGRGRGRGYGYGPGQGRGGGAYHQGFANGGGHYQDQNYAAGQQYAIGMNGQVPNGPNGLGVYAEHESGEAKAEANVDEFGRSLRDDGGKEGEDGGGQAEGSQQHVDGDVSQDDANNASRERTANQGADADKAVSLHGSNEGGDVTSSGGHGVPQQAAPEVPLNAPKGPKAMMWGLPNTSYKHLQARGWLDQEKPLTPTSANGMGMPSPALDQLRSRSSSVHGSKARDSDHHQDRTKEQREQEKERDYYASGRDGERDQGRDRDRHEPRSHSQASHRSRSPDRKDSHRRRPHRSYSVTEEEAEEDRHRRHRRKHSHAEEKDTKARSAREDGNEERSRSASPDDSRRSSHRSSRKERDPEKRREREKDRDREADHDHRRKSSHRSHRDRDYDRSDRDREREKDRDRDRDREKDRKDRGGRERSGRDRDREKEHRHRSSKKSAMDPLSPAGGADFNPPSGPRAPGAATVPGSRGIEIKGAGSKSRDAAASERSSSVKAQPSGQAGPDPHAAEREARDRERLLKETRRIASRVASGGLSAGSKRSRDVAETDEARRSRRKGRRGEVVSVEEEESRMRRLEAERESERYD
ncbi:hypothetical protein B0T22DRAFT_471843 [Podospora appendiculata]|uniref:RING-type domain-containing protein n=1 Tax=Podospora appendiculata TaxID=314037 RepID=A0AAE0X1C9_9PEZI|nr:hypothetical protein B0T22DRAFT_471843 [Podospora appendiculata]